MKYSGQLLLRASRKFLQDGCFGRASALAYSTLLTVVPMFAVLLIALSVVPSFKYLGQQIETFLLSNLVANSGDTVQTYIRNFSSQAHQLSIIGIAALFLMTALLMWSIETAFNVIWEVEARPGGRWFLLRAISRHWGMLLIIPILVAASLFVSSYVSSMNWLAGLQTHFDYPSFLVKLLPSMFIFFTFSFLFKFIPATKVYYKHACLASLIATLLFTVLKSGFAWYFKLFPTYQVLYGAFAAVPLFLIWLYVVWVMLLFCAEICFQLGMRSLSSKQTR